MNRKIAIGIYVFLMVVLLFGALEGLLVAFGDTISIRILKTDLDSYKMPDPDNRNNWVLVPGYQATLSGILEGKQQGGKILAVGVINRLAQEYDLKPDDILFQVDEFGFKCSGTDIESDAIRIMTIGDSCTFGLVYDWCSYPRTLERYLQGKGYDVEVINAGVEGYSTHNVLYRLDYFMSFKPDIAIVYVGWNDVYKERQGIRKLQTARAFEYLFSNWFGQQWIVEDGKLRFTDHYWDSSVSVDYEPSFMPRTQEIVHKLSENGIIPVIVTLPCIFNMDIQPSQEVLQIGHLPSTTKNAYVLAVMSRRYNDSIRELAKEQDICLFDLELWGKTVFNPSEDWFFDSVHPWAEGQIAIGEFIGQNLILHDLLR